LRTSERDPALVELARRLRRTQDAEDGWGHGLSVAGESYPSRLVASTNWNSVRAAHQIKRFAM
jgi:hypothetical protein